MNLPRTKLITETLEKININNNLKGYPILIEMIETLCNTNETEINTLKEIMATKYNTTFNAIDNILRNIIAQSSFEIMNGTISNEVTLFIGTDLKNYKTKNFIFIIRDYIIYQEQTNNFKNLSHLEQRRLLITQTMSKLNMHSSHKGYYIFIDIIEYLFNTNNFIDMESIKEIMSKKNKKIPNTINNNLKTIINIAKESILNGSIPDEMYLFFKTSPIAFLPINFLYSFKKYIKYLETKSPTANHIQTKEEFLTTLINSTSISYTDDIMINNIIEQAKKLDIEITPREIITLISNPKNLIKKLTKNNSKH